jgi:hypothetical protein
MKVLDRLPISKEDALTLVGSESVRLKKYEIIVWLSLTSEKKVSWDAPVQRFPAILDTGHTHNLAIQSRHLAHWGGLEPDHERRIGHIRHENLRLPLYHVNVWLHRNKPGTLTVSMEEPLLLELQHGIAVYPVGVKYPRLPLLGLRALLSNNLHLVIDGEHASVTMRTPDWRTRAATWLS